jgi:hypothetical protein
MSVRAVITVLREPDEVERLWRSSEFRPEYIASTDASVRFAKAPGDRGSEITVELEGPSRIGQAVGKLTGSDPRAKVKDDLRRFKQHVETGVIPRSEGSPSGEALERKLKQRPAQPLKDSELEKAGL